MFNSKVDEIVEEVEEKFMSVEDFISPYKLANLLSSFFSDKVIKPQMMYNYAKNNLLPTSLSSTQKMQVSKDVAIQFCIKYVSNHR